MPTFDNKTLMVMLDLETRSTKQNASIAQIGACAFTVQDGPTDQKFLINVAEDSRFHVSEDTMLFWKKQKMEVRESVFSNPVSVEEAIDKFEQWIRSISDNPFSIFVWSHGKEFDMGILQNAFVVLDKRFPIGYPYLMDTRTLFNVAGVDHKAGNTHNALEDCLNQIKVLREIL